MSEDYVRIVIQDKEEVLVTQEEARKINDNGDTATYRWSREFLASIIGRPV